MRFLPLVWHSLMRRKVRTIFTALSIVVALVLFAGLMAIRTAFARGVDLFGADRLVVTHSVSLQQPLPLAYRTRLATTPGIREVTHRVWFRGIYQDPANRFPQLAVDSDTWFAMYPEWVVPSDQLTTWQADRTGAIVGRALMDRFGWKVGDRIPMQSALYAKPDGSAWEFTIDGVYDIAKERAGRGQANLFFFHYGYFNQARTLDRDFTEVYTVRVADPTRAVEVAERIDAQFANSPFETTTSTENAFLQSLADQVGDVGAIVIAIAATVIFTVLLVCGNMMAQSIRERTGQIAVLKTLGFTDARVLGLVLLESSLLAVIPGAAGLGGAWLVIQQGDPTGGLLPAFYLPTRDLVLGGLLSGALGLAAGVLPAWQASRLQIVDALRRQD